MNQITRLIRGKSLLAIVFATPLAFAVGKDFFNFELVKIADLNNYAIDEKRDIFGTFEMEKQNDKGLPLDPFDLMNRLKQAGAMNDATTPSDALDEALEAFEQSGYENVPIN